MTQPLAYEAHNDPTCTDHPHCPFCGGVQVEEPSRVVCASCGTEAPIGAEVPAEAVTS